MAEKPHYHGHRRRLRERFLAADPDAFVVSPEQAPVSVHMEDVTKVYRLYGNPRQQVIDSLGLNRFLPRRRMGSPLRDQK